MSSVVLAACARTNPEYGLGADGDGDGDTAATSTGETTGSVSSGGSDPGTGSSGADPSTGGADVDTGPDPSSCPDSDVCVPIPDGWLGPLAVDGSNDLTKAPSACASPRLDGVVRRGAAGSITPPSDCCECQPVLNQCEPSIVAHSDLQCETTTAMVAADECLTVSEIGLPGSITFNAPVQLPGSCDEVLRLDPQPIPERVETVCDVEASGMCPGGVCAPDGLDVAGLAYPCIMQATQGGPIECPGSWAPYAAIRDIDSSYDCNGGSCECIPVATTLTECNPTLLAFDDMTCAEGNLLDTIGETPDCLEAGDLMGVTALRVVVEPGPVCNSVAASPPMGSFEEDNWAMICCKA